MSNVSSLGLQLMMTSALQTQQSTLGKLSEQTASSKKNSNLTDYNPIDAQNLLNFQNAITQKQSYISSIKNVQTRLTEYDQTMSDMEDIASLASSLAASSQNYDSTTASQIQAQAQNYLQQVVNDLNQKIGDRYIYAGSRYSTQPVTADTSVLYGTPQTTLTDAQMAAGTLSDYDTEAVAGTATNANAYTKDSVLVDTNYSITYGVSSNDPSFQKLINGLRYMNAAATAGQNGDTATYQSYMQQASTLLSEALSGIQTLHTNVASNQNTLTNETDAQNSDITNLKNQISDIQQVDLTEVGTEISLMQTQLQASYSVTSSLLQLSLVKYL